MVIINKHLIDTPPFTRFHYQLQYTAAVQVSEEFSSSGDSKTEDDEKRSPKDRENKEKDRDDGLLY